MSTPRPLDGLLVLDLSTIVSGGTTTSVLADFGARVIKVEHPRGGDPLRAWGPARDGVSLWWKVLSRNKESITLDLRAPRGQELLRALAARADALVENFRPGTLERWHLGPEVLEAINPRLVVVRISGFGQTGPYRDRPGFGTIAEAMSGYVALSGFPDGPPLLPPMPLADEVCGLLGAAAVLAAIHYRDHGGGRGQVIDLSLYEPLFRLLIPYIPQCALLGQVQQRTGNRFPGAAPRNLYQAGDGEWVAISATSQRTFERLAQAMGRPDLIVDPRFADNAGRIAHADALDAIIQDWMRALPLDEVLRRLGDAEAVAGPVYDTRRILADPHYAAREDVVTVADDELGAIPMPAVIPRFSRTPGQVAFAGPPLGAHNDRVYGDMLGLTREEMARLHAEGVI
ncbi:MAG: CoA transferase [Armatimonadota bacterium]|nr:CoA transferase [Armatimonadota bacterium]MDR7534489.1 CoA transferase [Armatimonadota bacterium]MDR7535547.1 CoA transferase [Armatimonadota bacterium]